MASSLVLVAAVLLDQLFGEPRRFHPLVGFGRYAQWLEQRLYHDNVVRGALAVLLALAPCVMLAVAANALIGGFMLDTVLVYLAIGRRSLRDHALDVADTLRADDLDLARERVGRIVSRDTGELDGTGVAKAALESVLENGADALFGVLFWYLLLGAPGVVLYRLANTLDAMWGYRNQRYRHFGRVAARLDDLLNLVPARLTALSYAASGHFRDAWRCWREQAPRWESPNAGPVMAAGAGALGVSLGGAARYHGAPRQRPVLGAGPPPEARDIHRGPWLVDRALVIWLLTILLGEALAR